jgi:DNA-directed RNA polymerase subunit RPC12/RpoP
VVYTCKVCGRAFHDDERTVLTGHEDLDASILLARCPDCEALLISILGNEDWEIGGTYIPLTSSLKHSLIRLVEVLRRWVEER